MGKELNIKTHPINQIQKLIAGNPILKTSTFNYSKVRYDYHEKIYLREKYEILGKDISYNWLTKELGVLKVCWELAFHSNIVHIDNTVSHIPCIDFNISKFTNETTSILNERLNKQDSLLKLITIIRDINIYSSGRSFHGYASHLLNESEWREFITSLILFNYTKNVDEFSSIVDVRWIAHRLLEGFGSLRWSCNSSHYLQYPVLVENLQLIS